MLQDEKPEIYLKRRRLAKDYFQHIPEELVKLDLYYQGTREQVHAHLSAYGLDSIGCGAVACLAGWLFTMPEYQDYCVTRSKRHDSPEMIENWIGIDPSEIAFEPRKASERNGGSDKAVALARLEGLIQEAEEACHG